MKRIVTHLMFCAFLGAGIFSANGQELILDTRIDNMKYWKQAAELGLTPVQQPVPVMPEEYRGIEIKAVTVKTQNSPDVPVTGLTNVTESENSVFIRPNDNDYVLNSNNSTSWSGGSVGTLYGANSFYSGNGGVTWGGSVQGAGGSNSGDPTTAINLEGRQFVGYIHDNYGQGVSYSDNGVNWTPVLVASPPGGWSSLLDKNHLWIDNSTTSPYEGNLYDAWTPFGGTNDSEIEIKRSTDAGLTWSSAINVSSAVNAGSHNQGVNIQTGPNGEVYVAWAIYDSWPSDETAIGFAKSVNGGASYAPALRIISNIRGIRNSEVAKNHRVNSFPSMAADISNSPYRGNLYVVWTNVGTPGVNTGTNRSVYMIRSSNGGTTWSSPVRVNQGPFVSGKEAYFPWITCDPETGTLSVIFYDDRNTSSSSCEVFVANSFDGGDTWEDFIVSDVSFTPSPIPGLASSYMGDYLGIAARGGKVYPCWTDNRGGLYMTYVSPFETNNLERPTNLTATLNEQTGQVDLDWDFNFVPGFLNFNVYRDDVLIGTASSTDYVDFLPTYGVYQYKVTAMHTAGESIPAAVSVQWGNPGISVSPASFYVTLPPDGQTTETLAITNIGQLGLTFSATTMINTKNTKAYCSASGGCDEYISRVQFNTIDNSSGCSGYADYTNISTTVNAGETYSITVENGNVYSSDDLGIWIDWNQDDDFTDPGENMVCQVGGGGQGTHSITIPNDALSGPTVMRIRIKYFGSDCGEPCGTTTYGEVEDYTVNVLGWISLNPMSGTINPGASQNVSVLFDATGMAVGTYSADILVSSNDPNQPLITVPAILNVSLGTPQIAVSPSSLAFGDVELGASATLSLNVQNAGTGPLSGTMTTPEGFSIAAADSGPENVLSFNVPPGSTKSYDVTFSPTAVQPYSGDIVISHNAGANPELVAVTGNGIPGPYPAISVAPSSFYVSLVQDNTMGEILNISNPGNSALNYSSSVMYFDEMAAMAGPLRLGYVRKNLETFAGIEVCPNQQVGYSAPGAGGEILIDLDVVGQKPEGRVYGSAYDGTHLWFTEGGIPGKNMLYRYDIQGHLLNSYPQNTSTMWGMRDMAFDGFYLYAGDEDGFYRIDPSSGMVTKLFSHTFGLEAIRGLAWHSGSGHFYAVDWSSNIVEFDVSGILHRTLPATGLYGMSGLACDAENDFLWIYNRTGNPQTAFYQYSLVSQTVTGVSVQVPSLTGLAGQENGGAFLTPGLIPGEITLCGIARDHNSDRFFAMGLGDAVTLSWLTITSNGSGSVPASGTVDMGLLFDATGMSLGTYTAHISITSNDPFNPTLVVPCTLEVLDGISLDIKVFLEGPFNGTEMYRFLNVYGYLPYDQPYNVAPWFYNGTEHVSPIPTLDVVDWVLLELRETDGDATTATSSRMVSRQAGLILRNGSIVSIDGVSPLKYQIMVTQQLYAVVWHRNHLPVMTAFPMTSVMGTYTYDFTTGSNQAYGGSLAHKEIAQGIWGMIGGDGNSNGMINSWDKNNIWKPEVGLSGYLYGDYDLNGNVDNPDKLEVWTPNAGKGSQVP
ncbi:MAG: choice-of-anchor D domain-containing protein [Bacteroidales bacterium]|nr:choice-of-anchor D domain-containing protein [Bacteroidales bacterium]